MLSLGRSRVYLLIATGGLANFRMGRSGRISFGAVDDFIGWWIGGEVRVAGVR